MTAQGMRYTDPLNPDTDGDGILDGQECPNGNCINSRGTGDPDVFVIDNDADGFIGSFDLSPNVALGHSLDRFGSGSLHQRQSLPTEPGQSQPDKSVFVDFQLRPTDPDQIGYAQGVLDWPTGDTEGQVQRRLDTTFADVNPLPPAWPRPIPTLPPTETCAWCPCSKSKCPPAARPCPAPRAAKTVPLANTPLLAVMQIIKQVEPYDILGFTIEPEALRVRVNYLSPDYSFTSYTLEIFKGACESALPATPVFPSRSSSENGEVTYPDGEFAVIGDGGHVAVLKAPNLTPNCLPIPKVTGDATQMPLNFVDRPVHFGNLQMTQTGERAIELTLTDFANTEQHTVEIYAGSCQKLGFRVGSPLLLTPGAAADAGRPAAGGTGRRRTRGPAQTGDAHPHLRAVWATCQRCAERSGDDRSTAALAKMGITVSEEDERERTGCAHLPSTWPTIHAPASPVALLPPCSMIPATWPHGAAGSTLCA